MLKYKVGQRVKTYSGTLGYIVEVDLGWPQPYRVKLDTGFELWIREDGLSIDLDFLQAENERLKAALEQIRVYAGVNPHMQDFSIVCDAFSGIRQVLIEIGIMALS